MNDENAVYQDIEKELKGLSRDFDLHVHRDINGLVDISLWGGQDKKRMRLGYKRKEIIKVLDWFRDNKEVTTEVYNNLFK